MPLLLLALVLVPIAEIYVLVQVGHAIGGLQTVVLLIAMSVLGGWLLRREGMRAWRAFTGAMSGGRLPAREVADGALVMFGGALLLTPGFLTDIVGLFAILPPTRAVLRRSLLAYLSRRMAKGGAAAPRLLRVPSFRAESPTAPRARQRGQSVIEGEIQPRREPPAP